MNRSIRGFLAVLVFSSAAVGGPAAQPKAQAPKPPAAGRSTVVAKVNDETISLADVERQVALVHMQAGEARPRSQDPTEILNRLITASLVAQEARAAGMDEVPEIHSAIDEAERALMRDLLIREWTSGAKADPAEVESDYKALVRQYVIQPVFVNNTYVEAFDKEVKGGADFAKVAKAYRDAGKAHGPEGPQPYKQSDLEGPVARILTFMKPGETTPPQKGKSESAFIHLVEVRYPEDPDARVAATEEALASARGDVVKRRSADLRAKYARVDEALLASIDFTKKGAAKALEKDARPLVQMTGEAPITVGDLTKAMERRFFHGVDASTQTSDVNKEKTPVLEDQINRRVVIAEARRRKLDQSVEFKERMAQKSREILFESYIERAVAPEVKIVEEDLKAYLAAHQKEYTTPEMMQIEAIAFQSRPDAESTLAKLQHGADLKWLKANAPGRLDPAKTKLLEFPEGFVLATTLPEELRKAMKGTKAGDSRFYAGSADGPFYVVVLRGYQPAQDRSLDDVRDQIQGIVYQEKLKKALDVTAAALRKSADIKIYATGDKLRGLLKSDMGARS